MAILLAFTEVVLAFGAIILAGFLYFNKNKKDPRYPPGITQFFNTELLDHFLNIKIEINFETQPGPRGVPLFGNVLQLGSDPVRVLQKFAEEYGSVYSIRMGTQDTIILNDPKLIKELFSDINSTGRPDNLITDYLSGRNGIVQGQGPNWECQRRFTLRKLRDFGVLKSSIEASLLEETARLIAFLDKRIGNTISGRKLFNGPVVNSLWKLIAGQANDWDSPVKPKILELATSMIEAGNRTVESGLFFASSLRFIAPGYYGWTEWVESVDKFNFLIKKAVQNHAEKLEPNEPNGFIDHILNEIKNALDPASFFYKENGGRSTKSTTGNGSSDWLISQYRWQIRFLLPCTEAILLEALRLFVHCSIGLPHRMIGDTIFHAIFYRKNATIISNLWAIHHDPKVCGGERDERT
ncbi:Cytochrome P450 2F2 [Orchesella cincta]|uniref:Cytochrome P450 2F2 n=1 Tax=Orchesella cincta TaxID=48709 RepID=A0A1D2M3Y6_ORCCI|nr:Cytochrome P450 2F2 [Orchesella cincta]